MVSNLGQYPPMQSWTTMEIPKAMMGVRKTAPRKYDTDDPSKIP